MRRLVPDFVLQRCSEGETGGRLTATVLSVDVVGFSTITDRLSSHGQQGAEAMAMLMRRVFSGLIDAVHRNGGFVIGFAGDALTAVFADELIPDGAKRAVTAAAMMSERSGSAETTPFGEFAIDVRIGAGRGEVAWGIALADDLTRAAYFFHGSAVDDAAALQQMAEPGSTLVTAAVVDSVGPTVATARMGDHLILERGPVGVVPLDPAPAPTDFLDVLRLFVPDEVIFHAASGEFRHVVNVFIRVPTVRTDAQLAMLLRTVFALQTRHGGLFGRLDFGDKGAVLMLFWGAPVAHENDVMTALDFVVDLQAESEVSLEAGIAYGLVHAGFIGNESRDEYTCYGPPTNLAARLMTEAPRGETWVDESIAQKAGAGFELDLVGDKRLKGFTDAIRVFSLGERRLRGETRFDGTFVGRGDEIQRLDSFLQSSFNVGHRGVALVRGEAGIGKSRLVHEVVAHRCNDVDGQCTVAVCQSDETVRDSLNPFRYWLRRRFGQGEHQSLARNKRAFSAVLDELIATTTDPDLAGELDRTRSFLGALVGLNWSDSLYEELTGEARRENTFISLISLLRAEALKRPLVLVLEDVHWLDDDSRAFLPELLRAIEAESAPVAVVATSRPHASPLPGVNRSLTVDLEVLTLESIAEIAERQLGGPISPELAELLADRAGGNPFFAEELLRFLRDSKALVQHDGSWGRVSGMSSEGVPTDIRTVLVARFDALERSVSDVVMAGAVLGREGHADVVARMMGAESVDEQIATAEAAGIWTIWPDRHFMFRHALVRDAAYQMQSMARRTALHEQALMALESFHAADASPPHGELGFHAERAGRPAEARHHLQLAGDAAAERFSNEQAAAHYTRALELTPEDAAEERFVLLLGREHAYSDLGLREEQLHDLEELADLAGRLSEAGAAVDIALRRCEYLLAVGDYDAAFEAGEQAAHLASALGDPRRLAAAHATLGRHYFRSDHGLEVDRHLQAATELARRHGFADIEADAQVAAGIAASERDRYDEARGHFERGLEGARRARDRRVEAWALNALGLLHLNRDEYEQARGYLEQALAIRREIGYRLGEAGALTNLAIVAEVQGRLAEAIRDHEEAMNIAIEIGDGYNEAWARNNLGFISATLGRFDAAADAYRRALAIGEDLGDRRIQGDVLANMSLMAHQMGDDAEALELARRAAALASTFGAREMLAEASTNEGHALVGLGHLDDAEFAYRRGLAIRAEVGQATKAVETVAGLARVQLAKGDVAAASALVEPLIARLDAGALSGTFEPMRVYLTFIDVLRAADDPRADELETRAHDELMRHADSIEDEDLRASYLENVAAHRELASRRGATRPVE